MSQAQAIRQDTPVQSRRHCHDSRSCSTEEPAAGGLVLGRLCRRRDDATDRWRGTLRGPRSSGGAESARRRRRKRECQSGRCASLVRRHFDRLCAELAGARSRAGIGRRTYHQIQGGRRRGIAVRRWHLRRRRLDLRRDVHAQSEPSRCRTPARLQIRRQDRSRKLDAGRLYRTNVQDTWQIHAASGRRKIARALGHARTSRSKCSVPPQSSIQTEPRNFNFRYRSAEHFLDVFRTYYGPVLKAFAALDEAKQDGLKDDLHALIARMNKANDGTMVVPSEYLEVVITKR